MQAFDLNTLLKPVSRSFYLSLRLLPSTMRNAVSLAYLLARAADSIADSTVLDRQTKQQALENFQQLLPQSNEVIKGTSPFSAISDLLENPHEKHLVKALPYVLQNLLALPATEQQMIQQVVKTLVDGMLLDMKLFNDDNIIALENMDALESYTYHVAGCVGEFWTRLAMHKLPSLRHWNESEQIERGIAYGKVLQLTNILRDVASDARLGRCYIPLALLESNNLVPEQLLYSGAENAFRSMLHEYMAHWYSKLKPAKLYLTAIPAREYRFKLASTLPLMIAMETMLKIQSQQGLLDVTSKIKIPRRRVYEVVLFAASRLWSEQFTEQWFIDREKQLKLA